MSLITWLEAFVDMIRSSRESKKEHKMARRTQLEHELIFREYGVYGIVTELVRLVGGDGGFANRTQIREIGEKLFRIGGFNLMKEAMYYVRGTGTYFSQDIWHNIGPWQQ